MADIITKKKDEAEFNAPTELRPKMSVELAYLEESVDPVVERKALRKIDSVVMPLMCVVFFFQYLDKTSIAYAAVFGMRTDTHLHGQEYSWLTTMFYLGQFTAEYPFIYLLASLPVARFVGTSIIVWGGVCMAIAAVQNFAGFATVRFLLGFSEGAVSPAFVLITSYWYKRSEHPLRTACWVSFNGIAQIVGALLMFGIGKIEHSAIATWRLMFLVIGACTMLFGVLFTVAMPKSPLTAWFLNKEEKHAAHRRLVLDQLTQEHTAFSWAEVREAVLDPKVWCLFVVAAMTCITASIITFGAIIIAGFGHDSFTTMLLGLPAGGIQIFFIWVGVGSMQFIPNSRAYTGAILSIVPLVGSILLLVLPLSSTWALVISCWLATVISDIFVIALSLCASNVKGNTKKSAVTTIYFIGYCVGCCIGPQFWKTDQAPRYRSGCICNVACYCILIVTFLVYRMLCVWDNRSRDKLEVEEPEAVGKGQMASRVQNEGLTDKRDMTFRYVL